MLLLYCINLAQVASNTSTVIGTLPDNMQPIRDFARIVIARSTATSSANQIYLVISIRPSNVGNAEISVDKLQSTYAQTAYFTEWLPFLF